MTSTSNYDKFQSDIKDSNYYPRVNENANIPITLQSNKNATFFVDGKEVGKGKKLTILVEQNPYSLAVMSEGFKSKEQDINPPYSSYTVIEFIFMIGDKIE